MKPLIMITILVTGLSAGIFFSWTVTNIPGLKKLQDITYIQTMQSINKEILNPVFYLVFLSPIVLLPLCTYIIYKAAAVYIFKWFLFAFILYSIGVFGITATGNVPLNNQLERVEINNSNTNLKEIRNSYEKPWNRYHYIRTVAAVLSFVSLIMAFINQIKFI